MKSQRITEVIRIHPLGTINNCIKFHGKPSNTSEHISIWTKVVDRHTNNAIPEAMPLAWLKPKQFPDGVRSTFWKKPKHFSSLNEFLAPNTPNWPLFAREPPSNFLSSRLAVMKHIIQLPHSLAVLYWLAVVSWVTASVVMLHNLPRQVALCVDDKRCQRALGPKLKWIHV